MFGRLILISSSLLPELSTSNSWGNSRGASSLFPSKSENSNASLIPTQEGRRRKKKMKGGKCSDHQLNWKETKEQQQKNFVRRRSPTLHRTVTTPPTPPSKKSVDITSVKSSKRGENCWNGRSVPALFYDCRQRQWGRQNKLRNKRLRELSFFLFFLSFEGNAATSARGQILAALKNTCARALHTHAKARARALSAKRKRKGGKAEGAAGCGDAAARSLHRSVPPLDGRLRSCCRSH